MEIKRLIVFVHFNAKTAIKAWMHRLKKVSWKYLKSRNNQ